MKENRKKLNDHSAEKPSHYSTTLIALTDSKIGLNQWVSKTRNKLNNQGQK